MRLLFYIEPFPVRDRPLDFQWIWDKWSRLAPGLRSRGITCAFAVSDALKAANPAPAWRVLAPGDLGVPPAEQSGEDAEWVALMSHPEHPLWSPFVDRLLDETSPDIVVTWTVNGPLAKRAAARGVALLHVELGPVRLPWGNLYFSDPRGVNGVSSLPAMWSDIRSKVLSDLEERQLDAFVNEFVRGRRDEVVLDGIKRRCALETGKPTVGVFLQMQRDSNVLLWSRVKDTAALMESVARRFPSSSFQYVIKAHPGDPHPVGLGRFLSCLAPPCRAQDIIDLSDVICTINSSVGIEGLAAEKPVYAFGASPYDLDGCTRSVTSESSGPSEPFTPSERTLSRRLLHFLFFQYFAWEDEIEDPDAFAARVARFLSWHRAGQPLADWFAANRDACRLLTMRSRRAKHEGEQRLEETVGLLTATRSAVAAIEAQLRVLEQEREALRIERDALRSARDQLEVELSAREVQIRALEASRALDQERLRETAAALASAQAAVSHLENSLPIRAGNALRRVPLVVPLIRFARGVGQRR